jgi:phage shock protein PspC (stress-responsive transcriptional regulator)
MQKVVHVNLSGNAYVLEEPAYAALQAYLEKAGAQLGSSPDRAEILADLEQAIAEKCGRFLGAKKSVITLDEVEQVLKEMGPVENPAGEGGAGSHAGASAASTEQPTKAPKRLYLIREGGMIGGLCNGLAAYFGVDPTIVRVIFVLLAIVTKGLWILVYLIMLFVIPYAETSEQQAAARGLPFTAKALIDRAKQQAQEFAQSAHWRDTWKWQRKQWKWQRRQWREYRRQAAMTEPFVHVDPVGASAAAPILALLSAAFTVAWIVALAMLVSTGKVFGVAPPAGVPLWAAALGLLVLGNLLAAPLKAARWANYRSMGVHGASLTSAWGELIRLGLIVLLFWLAYQHIPALHGVLSDLPGAWAKLRASWNVSGI